MNIDWPELSDQEIEYKAATFRDEAIDNLNIPQSASVPVEQIAEFYLGYNFDFVKDLEALPRDIIGGIDFDSKTIIINEIKYNLLNSSKNPTKIKLEINIV